MTNYDIVGRERNQNKYIPLKIDSMMYLYEPWFITRYTKKNGTNCYVTVLKMILECIVEGAKRDYLLT